MLEDYRNSGGRGEGRLQLLEEIRRSSSFTQTGRALVQKPWKASPFFSISFLFGFGILLIPISEKIPPDFGNLQVTRAGCGSNGNLRNHNET